MKFRTKSEFEQVCEIEWQSLWKLIGELDDQTIVRREKSGGNSSSSTGRSIKDRLAHLHCWHRLLLAWEKTASRGLVPDLPAKGYNWGQTRPLNQELFVEFRDVPLATVKRKLKLLHSRVMKWIATLSESEFQEPQQFEWTGKNPISSYVVPNTVSHYRWAQKKIKKST